MSRDSWTGGRDVAPAPTNRIWHVDRFGYSRSCRKDADMVVTNDFSCWVARNTVGLSSSDGICCVHVLHPAKILFFTSVTVVLLIVHSFVRAFVCSFLSDLCTYLLQVLHISEEIVFKKRASSQLKIHKKIMKARLGNSYFFRK